MAECEEKVRLHLLGSDTSGTSSSNENIDRLSIVNMKTYKSEDDNDYYKEKRNNYIKWTVAIVSCIVNFLYGCVTHGITGIIAVHLERRFSYESVYTGVIMTGNDISAILLGPLIGYYCSKKYCGRWMGFGAVIVAVGCMVFTLPHSLSDKYTPSNVQTNYTNVCSAKQVEFCNFTSNPNMASLEMLSPKISIGVFYTGQVLMGIGGILVDILSLIFIDDSFEASKVSGVMALWYISHYSGPLLGLVVGSASLRKWIDIPDIPLVDYDHPAWLGAWWLSYRIIGVVLLILGLLLLALSNSFNSVLKFKCKGLKRVTTKYLNISVDEDDTVVDNNTTTTTTTTITSDTKISMELFSDNHMSFINKTKTKKAQFMTSFRRIMLNPIFVLSVFGQITTCTVMVGVVSFLPKILLIVFDVPPSNSGFTLALAGGGAAIVGVFFTSNLIKFLEIKKKLYQIIILCIFTSLFISMQGGIYWTGIGCEELTVYGHSSINSHNVSFLKSSCAENCTCPSLFDPMCDNAQGYGKTYFSPCTAGCQKVQGKDNIFLNCSCLIPQNNTNIQIQPLQPYMGTCKRKCSYYIVFIAIIAMLSFLGVASSASQNSIILRCVDTEDRALALSIQSSFIKVVCYVPSPIIFGSIIDFSCSDWVHTGNLDYQYHCYHIVDKVCMTYDIKSLKASFGSISVAFGLVGSILYILAYRASKSKL